MATFEQRLLNHIHYILIQRWDPIGVRDQPNAQDEYDEYIPGVLGLLISQADPMRIAQHMVAIETDWMGLRGNLDHAIKIAHELRVAYQLYQQPMELSCYARVRLVTDRYRDEQAPCGAIGFIIEIHSLDAYEVECSRADGTTYAQIVVHPDEIILDEQPAEND